MKKLFLPVVLSVLLTLVAASVGAGVVLKQSPYELSFSDSGDIVKLTRAGETILYDGTLFEIVLADGKSVKSSDAKLIRAEQKSDNEAEFAFTHEQADVVVRVTLRDGRVEFFPSVTSKTQPVFTLGAPSRFLFPVKEDNRVYMTGMLGLELLPQYFRKQTLENAIFGGSVKIGEEGLRQVLPEAKIGFDTVEEQPVLTDAGREWLGGDPELTQKLPVVRPSIDENHIPLLVCSKGSVAALYPKGKGAYLRLGTRPAGIDRAAGYHRLLGMILSKVASGREGGFKVGRVTGPLGNAGLDTRRNAFTGTLRRISRETGKELSDTLLRTWPDLEEVLRNPAENPVIINFFFEAMPARSGSNWQESAALIRQYVENGGLWVNFGGGYDFFNIVTPQEWNGGSHSLHVDGGQGFSDFLMKSGSLPFSVYGVRSFPEPEVGKKLNPDEYPVVTSFGVYPYSSNVGSYSRKYETWSVVGQPYRLPKTVIRLGGDLRSDYLAYGEENNLNRTLAEKVQQPLLDTWKKSLFLKINDKVTPIREWTKFVEEVELPGPVLYHHADWSHQDGHFDEYYPDYFPLDEKYGTTEELKTFYDTVKKHGSLVMAYMNPVYWDARVAKMDGRPVLEYGMDLAGVKEEHTPETMSKFLYTLATAEDRSGKVKGEWGGRLIDMSPWNPIMIAMNEKVYDTFIKELGTSIYFHDSVGAKRYRNDYGPNAPHPTAHLYGVMAMANGQRQRTAAPLATEGGGDLFIPYYSMFCGVNHYLMPTSWNVYVPWLERYALGSVRPFPFAQYLAHDKIIFIGHNLGNSVFCRDSLTWYLLGGYQLQFGTTLQAAKEDLAGEASWIRTLSAIQSVVGPEMLGEVMVRCEYIAPQVLETEYANGLTVTGNLQQVAYDNIAPYGFLVRRNGTPLAGIVMREDGSEYWFVVRDGEECELKVPAVFAQYETTVEPSKRTTQTPVDVNPPPERGVLNFPAGVPAPVTLYSFETLDDVKLVGDGRQEPGIVGQSLRTMYSGAKPAFATVSAGTWLNGRTSWAIGFWLNVLDFSDWRDAFSFGDGRFRLEVNGKNEWALYDSGIRSQINLGIPVVKKQWRFFFFNSDGRTFSIWSGVDQLEKIYSENISARSGIRAGDELVLGARNDKGGNVLFCRVDELAIWGDGLSDAAIRAVFDAGKSGKVLE